MTVCEVFGCDNEIEHKASIEFRGFCLYHFAKMYAHGRKYLFKTYGCR